MSHVLKRFLSAGLMLTFVFTTTAYPLITRADDDAATAAPDATTAPANTTTAASTADTSSADTSSSADTNAAASTAATNDDTTNSTSNTSASSNDDSSITATQSGTDPSATSADASDSDAGTSPATLDGALTNVLGISSTTPVMLATSTMPSSASTTLNDASTTSNSMSSGGDVVDASSSMPTSTDSTYPIDTTASTTDTDATTTLATTTPDTATSTPVIQSGEAVALANIMNIVNTNFVNSTGSSVLLNYIDPETGDIDLRNASSTLLSGSVCQEDVCTGDEGTTVNLQSTGDLQNAIVVQATSGGNAIDDPNSTAAVISTGDAYAGVNLINLANTNIVNSNYLLVTLNAFQGVNGDIIFPSLNDFLNSLTSNLSAPSDVSLNGDSTVSNTVATDADTGDNTTASTTNATISTGQAGTSGNVFNQLNSNIIGGGNVTLMFRVQGNWAGQVFGAPAGLSWTKDADGNVYLFTDNGSSSTPATEMPGSITASSTGDIGNNVNVVALTGQNAITDADSAAITTGNAEASANVLNVANTNIVGKNWILAIVNIFGNFTGNIDFGRPDLFAGIQASAPSTVTSGSTINYTLSVINNGDADASNATLTDTYDAQDLSISNASVPYTTNPDGTITWDLGTIPSGKAEQITYSATVQPNTGFNTPMQTSINATETEPDNNTTDNSDSVTVSTESQDYGGNENEILSNYAATPLPDTTDADAAPASDLQVIRSTATSTPDVVTGLAHESLTVFNPDSATSTPVVLHDILTDPNGTQIADQSWNVGVVRPHEKVVVQYNAQFKPGAAEGDYELSSALVKSDNTFIAFKDNGTIVVQSLGQVLGASTMNIPTPATPTLPSAPSGNSNASSTPSSVGSIFGTPRAQASNGLAAAGSAPEEGLAFWLSVVFGILVLMGLGGLVSRHVRRT